MKINIKPQAPANTMPRHPEKGSMWVYDDMLYVVTGVPRPYVCDELFVPVFNITKGHATTLICPCSATRAVESLDVTLA